MRRLALVLLLACLVPAPARAQGLRHLIQQLFIFGPGEDPLFLAGTADPSNPATIQLHGDHFTPAAAAGNGTVISFIESAIAGSVAEFPFSSASGGSTFRFEGGAPVRTSTSAGPVFAERAMTLGKGRALAGFSYNSFHYTSLRGVNLNAIQLTFTHENVTGPGCDSVAGRSCDPMGVPNLENDIMPFVLSLDIDVKLASFVLTYGITDRLDVGVALPIVSTSLMGHSDARIIPFGGPTAAHFFAGTPANPVLEAQRFVQGTASGLGDVAARAKLNVHSTEQTSIAVLADARFPTGSSRDLLGSGRFSGRLVAVLSSRYGDFSPHVNFGYLYRGGGTRNDAIVATGGFDHLLAPWATLAMDIVSALQVGESKLVVPGAVHYEVPFSRTVETTTLPNSRDDLVDGSVGLKLQAARNVTIVANTLWPLNRGGLRANVLWTLGAEYNF